MHSIAQVHCTILQSDSKENKFLKIGKYDSSNVSPFVGTVILKSQTVTDGRFPTILNPSVRAILINDFLCNA